MELSIGVPPSALDQGLIFEASECGEYVYVHFANTLMRFEFSFEEFSDLLDRGEVVLHQSRVNLNREIASREKGELD